MLTCPFCGAPESDRFDLEGRRFLVFRCLFTPEVDPRLSEPEIRERLAHDYRPDGSGAYFRRMCDRLHYYVTAGEGRRVLARGTAAADGTAGEPAPGGPAR